MSQFDKLPTEILCHIGKIMESNEKYHTKQKTIKFLNKFLKQHFILLNLGEYNTTFIKSNYYNFEPQFLTAKASNYKKLFKRYSTSKNVIIRQDTCFCIENEPIQDFIVEYFCLCKKYWNLNQLFVYLNEIDFIPECHHHTFFEGYSLIETRNEVIITFHYGS